MLRRGDYSASCSFAENNPTLVSPRLDCSTGTHELQFDYANVWEPTADDAPAPESEFEVYFFKKWQGNVGESCYVRFYQPMVAHEARFGKPGIR